MKNFEDQDKKSIRKSSVDNIKKHTKKSEDFSEEQYAKNKQKKQYKLKKNELRAQELWQDWESD